MGGGKLDLRVLLRLRSSDERSRGSEQGEEPEGLHGEARFLMRVVAKSCVKFVVRSVRGQKSDFEWDIEALKVRGQESV